MLFDAAPLQDDRIPEDDGCFSKRQIKIYMCILFTVLALVSYLLLDLLFDGSFTADQIQTYSGFNPLAFVQQIDLKQPQILVLLHRNFDFYLCNATTFKSTAIIVSPDVQFKYVDDQFQIQNVQPLSTQVTRFIPIPSTDLCLPFAQSVNYTSAKYLVGINSEQNINYSVEVSYKTYQQTDTVTMLLFMCIIFVVAQQFTRNWSGQQQKYVKDVNYIVPMRPGCQLREHEAL